MKLSRAQWAAASGALMIIGGFGPWATVLGFSVSSTEADGWILIIGGALAATLALWKRGSRAAQVVVLLIAFLTTVTAGYDITNVSAVADGTFLDGAVNPGWGLYLSLIASLSLLAAAISLLVRGARIDEVEPVPTGTVGGP